MATWYWVAAAPANFATANWATTSGGTASGQPATGDTAIFDSHSSQTCTIAAAVSLAALDCQGGTGNFAGTLAHSAFAVTISAAGVGVRLSSGMTYTPASASASWTFTNTTGIAQITSAGHYFGSITVNGAGGTVQQQDDLTLGSSSIASCTLNLTAGTFDCNGHNLTCQGFSSSNSNTRALLLGASMTFGGNIGGNTSPWNTTTTTGFTFTTNGAPVTFKGPQVALGASVWTFASGALAFAALIFQGSSNNVRCGITGSFSCTSLTIKSALTMTVSPGAVAINGTVANPVCMVNENGANVVSFSCAAGGTANFAALGGISGSGGGVYTATNSFNLGDNTNWSVAPPVDATLNGASAVWQDTFTGGDFATPGSVGALMAAMQNLQFTVPAMARGTVGSGATTTSVPTSALNLLGAGPNRAILFDAATTTAALQGAAATVSASSGGLTPTLTVSALPVAPASGDTFTVI
jgi:hypothetical protein